MTESRNAFRDDETIDRLSRSSGTARLSAGGLRRRRTKTSSPSLPGVKEALPGIALIAFGLFLVLFPQWNAEATAQMQRGWISILPWMKRRDPDNDWMTDVGVWRVLTRVIGAILIVVGFRMLLRS